MKKVIIAASLSLGLVGLAACGSSSADPDVIVETEAGNVTKEDFYEALKQESGEQVLTDLVTMVVLENKYDVSDEEVKAELDNLKERLGEAYEDALQAQGVTEEDLLVDIRKGLLQEKAVTDGIEVDEEEMKQYYDRMKTEVKAKHILVEDIDTAEKVLGKLDKGDDFGKLAKEYSQDTASAESGGDLGFFSVGEMVEPFENAAYTLDIDKVSEPIESDFGYHIIVVTERKEIDEDIGTYEENEEEIRRTLTERKIDPETAMQKIDELVSETKIKVKIKEFEDLFDKDQAKG